MPRLDQDEKITESPSDYLKPYRFHGMQIDMVTRDEGISDCPWCGKHKWHVSALDGKGWHCKTCGRSGNSIEFLRKLHETCLENTNEQDYKELAENRNLLHWQSLERWGLAKSIISEQWVAPGYNAEGKIITLYKYLLTKNESGKRRMAWHATPGFEAVYGGHGLFLSSLVKDEAPRPFRTIYIAEGLWDGIALWESLGRTRKSWDGSYEHIGVEEASLLADGRVIAIPAAMVFFQTWTKLLENKEIFLITQNDLVRVNEKTGARSQPSLDGMKRLTKICSRSEVIPKCVRYVNWEKHPQKDDLADGYDVRDLLGQGKTEKERSALIGQLFELVDPVPPEWIGNESPNSAGRVELSITRCDSWSTLESAWDKAIQWSDSLSGALATMAAVCLSTDRQDLPIWLRLVSPASGGKTTLCEAVSTARKHVFANSCMRGFHSGYKDDKDGTKDNSLIPKIRNKTLITKDGDTLLSSPNKDIILSEARDLYDKAVRVNYRNGIDREYTGVNMTWILAGTESLRNLDGSELGERFIDYRIEGVGEDEEEIINMRNMSKLDITTSVESNCSPETQQDVFLTRAMQLTGGYIEFLRDNATDILQGICADVPTKKKISNYAKFVSFLRARPAKRQSETQEREFSFRLCKQFYKVGQCIAAVLGKTTIDEKVLSIVKKIALDTARGRTLKLSTLLYKNGRKGKMLDAISRQSDEPDKELEALLRFMQSVKIVENKRPMMGNDLMRPHWCLTENMYNLFELVTGE